MHRLLLLFSTLLLLLACNPTSKEVKGHAPFLKVSPYWADSVLTTLNIIQKVNQLILISSDDYDPVFTDSLLHWKRTTGIGGVWLKNWSLENFYHTIKSLEEENPEFPFFVASAEAVALNNQFSNCLAYPTPLSVSAINDDSLQFKLLQRLADQHNALKINLNLSLDFSNLPLDRHSEEYALNASLTSNTTPYSLSDSKQHIEQLQQAGVITVGQFSFDHSNPLAATSSELADSNTSSLHRQLFKAALSGVFLNKLPVEKDKLNNIKHYLTDSTEMRGLVFANYQRGRLDQILQSGAQVIVLPDSLPKNLLENEFLQLIQDQSLSEADLDKMVAKVLKAKLWASQKYLPGNTDWTSLNSDHHRWKIKQLYRKGIIIAQNPDSLLPFKDGGRHFTVLNASSAPFTTFTKELEQFAYFRSHKVKSSLEKGLSPINRLASRSKTIVLLDQVDLKSPENNDFTQSLNELAKRNPVVVVNFGFPGSLEALDAGIAIVQIFERNEDTEQLAAQVLFGAETAFGKLPFALSANLPYKAHFEYPAIRMSKAAPEELGISSTKLVGIDAIVNNAIREKAIPGAQVLVAKNGKVFYNKSFGYHTYDKKTPVKNSDLYDLASITKVAATTLAAMKLYDEEEFKLNDKLEEHLSAAKGKRVGKLKIRELLTHTSGLQPNMPIAKYVLTKTDTPPFINDYFASQPILDYNIEINPNLYFNKLHLDTIMQKVYDLRSRRKGRYRYSDVNMILIQKMIEEKTGMGLDEYVYANFYYPLGIKRLRYNPRKEKNIELNELIPTQLDNRWRKNLVHGFVHDESAALLGGVAGNAGLFSNASDLAVLLQMILNDGAYGGRQYISSETISIFTKGPYRSDRAYGFEKPWSQTHSTYSSKASKKSYGHSGFTGTCIWVDPEEELIYIFLANRIHPNSKNWKMTKKRVRQSIHNVVYDALDSFDPDKTPKPSNEKIAVEPIIEEGVKEVLVKQDIEEIIGR